MAFIGSLIKNVIDISGGFVLDKTPVESQKKVLRDLLDKAQDTAFGRYYGFKNILEQEDIAKAFRDSIPYFDYRQMQEKWWGQLHKGIPDISWPGHPEYYALSSGTTGKTSKKIPITDDMLESVRRGGIGQITAMKHFDMPEDFFEKEIMMLGSSTNLEEVDGHYEGEISGISASNIPFWFRGYYKPGEEIAQIDDWDERVQHIAENAKNWDIGALSGIPSWMELMLKKVIDYHNADTIHDVWPNLKAFTSGGVAFEPYRKSFHALMGKEVKVIDTYLASEGFIACQQRPETSSMRLLTDNGIYFEFVPFDPDYINSDGSLTQEAPAKSLDEVEKDQDYILILSSVSGAWRYLIGDTIKFTDIERAEIKITGRTKFFLNVVGSQLSVNKMNDAIQKVEEKHDLKFPEFTVAAEKIDGDFHHHWFLGQNDDKEVDEEQLAADMDEFLKEANKNYAVARSKALKGVKVSVIPLNIFHEWSSAGKKKGGQVKMEKVMGEEKFEEFKKFVAKHQ